MTKRTATLLIAVASTIATALLAVKDVVSPAWALVIAAVGTGLYGLTRSLQKVSDGATLKSLLSTTEAQAALLVTISGIVMALAGVVPPKFAGGATLIAGLLLSIARQWQGKKLPSAGGPPQEPNNG